MTRHQSEPLSKMQAAFAARDRSWGGRFVVGVVSTGIYCRPSCPARRPKPENTRFFASAGEPAQAGFRPCMRCRPDDVARDMQAVNKALQHLRNAGSAIPLADLAAFVGYSPGHFQRVFTRATGISPAVYGRALRDERARQALSESERVSDTLYDAGFQAPSRFYESTAGRLGRAASIWVRGGAGVTIRWAVVESSLGPILVAATEKGVCRVSFGGGRAELERHFPNAELVEGGEEFAALVQRVIGAVNAPANGQDIPLDVRGTAFQERVWAELRKIPAGETRSYAELAAAAGNSRAVRAVGSANGANHVPVLIPCHRVIRSDGSLGGYSQGLEIKRVLLERERLW